MNHQQKYIDQGYGEKKSKDDNLAIYSSWCSVNHKPFITIRKKIKYCEIQIDLIFTQKCLSLSVQDKVFSIFKNSCPEKYEKYHIADVGGTFTICKWVLINKGEEVIKEIVEIINKEGSLIDRKIYHCEYRNELIAKISKANENSRKAGSKNEGYIYFIQAEDRNIFKIGFSKNNPRNRIKGLQNGSPYDLFLRHYFYTIDCVAAEAKIHSYLSKYPSNREWFFVTPLQISKVIDYCYKYVDVALESKRFSVLENKYLVLKSKVANDLITVVTEKCPFCGEKHYHGTGGVDYIKFIEITEGITTLGHRVAHCTNRNVEFILPNNIVVNNNDGYYLGVDL